MVNVKLVFLCLFLMVTIVSVIECQDSDEDDEDDDDSSSESTSDEDDSDDDGDDDDDDDDDDSGESSEENTINLQDVLIPSVRRLKRFNNSNCTSAQKQQGINEYKTTRVQLIQSLITQVNVSSQTNATLAVGTTSNPLEADNSTSTAILSPTGIRSCDRATKLLASVDKYVRFNDQCQARVFEKKHNPDYYIEHCMKSLRKRYD